MEGEGERILGKRSQSRARSQPHPPFCINPSYGLSVDAALQSHRPRDGQAESAPAKLGVGAGAAAGNFLRKIPRALPVHPHQFLGTWGHTDREASHQEEVSLGDAPSPPLADALRGTGASPGWATLSPFCWLGRPLGQRSSCGQGLGEPGVLASNKLGLHFTNIKDSVHHQEAKGNQCFLLWPDWVL